MPKHIQMGTGFPLNTPPALTSSMTASSSQQSQTNLAQVNEGTIMVSQPDLLSDHNNLNRHNNRYKCIYMFLA